ncbi:MAG TPA: selenocysteine-specific translation elongation factor [Blastocatellia bacterium]|nr:selenocysteine-specific translation elongation factor [Blastocatellia bacterium]
MKHIIVGTAGHIDHGKTALVKALTGIDADRLKEEKQRGITIDIGFADLAIGDYEFGFVDVPGHERFVKNMLAGAHGLDLVMLVVAADESVMPQTREHFDICKLLHLKSGLIALTKSDMVDSDLLELARSEVEEFVAGSFLAGAPVIPVSSKTGAGIHDLKTALVELTSRIESKAGTAIARLPIDRAFSIKGFGTVVTGTLVAGEIRTGDELEVLPEALRTRARNVQVHGRDTDLATAGQRTAINLQGINVEQVQRGSVLAPAGRLRGTSMIDVRLELLPSAPRPLGHRARVRLHHGTAEVMSRVIVLGGEASIQPGGAGLAQLRLEEPITAIPGDRFIIRSYSPQVTIGGGVVLDGLAPKHRIRDVAVAITLKNIEAADAAAQLHVFVGLSGAHGLSAKEIAERTGATDLEIAQRANTLIASGKALQTGTNPLLLLSADAYQKLAASVIEMLENHHKREPLSLGLAREEVRVRVFGHARPEVFRAVISRLQEEGRIAAERDILRLWSHRPELSDSDAVSKAKLENALKAAGLQAGTLEESAGGAGIPLPLARKLYDLLLIEKKVVRIGDMVFHADSIEDLKAKVRAQKSKAAKIDVAVFKEITGGLTRKHAIPLLEYLDRERITRRIGNEREIL